jgi:hypothetical protein
MSTITQYAKFIMALLGTIGASITTQFPSAGHWVSAVIAAVTAILVLLVPNSSGKTAAAKK